MATTTDTTETRYPKEGDVYEDSHGRRWEVESLGPKPERLGSIADLVEVDGQGRKEMSHNELHSYIRQGNYELVETVFTTVEMKPHWWAYAIRALQVGRKSVEQMHPFEKEVHELDESDYDEALGRIEEAGIPADKTWVFDDVERVEDNDVPQDGWLEVDLTGTDVECMYEGLIDMRFQERDLQGGDWGDVSRPRVHRWVDRTCRMHME